MRLRVYALIALVGLACSTDAVNGVPLLNATLLIASAAPGVALDGQFMRGSTQVVFRAASGDSTCVEVPAAPDSIDVLVGALEVVGGPQEVYAWHARRDSVLVARLTPDTVLSVTPASQPCTP